MELIFEVLDQETGGYTATCLNYHLRDAKGASLEELHESITAVVDAKFTGRAKPDPSAIHLLYYPEQVSE